MISRRSRVETITKRRYVWKWKNVPCWRKRVFPTADDRDRYICKLITTFFVRYVEHVTIIKRACSLAYFAVRIV